MKIDKKVVGFRGPQTSLHEQRTREDRLVPEEQAARQPVPESRDQEQPTTASSATIHITIPRPGGN